MRLPDPTQSQVLLIGVGAYQSADLPNVPAVRNNLNDLVAALTDAHHGGFAEATALADPSSVRLTYRAIREHADNASDTLLVYFAGHGLAGPRRGELYLALSDTEPNELSVSALSFDLVRDIFLDCPANNRILILDCCFSGRATQNFLAAPEALPGEVDITGTYILASTPPNALALAPPGATHTAFTSELLCLLTRGIQDGPELLTLGTTYRHLRRTMTAKGLPVPGQRGSDTADLLALARNPAFQTRHTGTEGPINTTKPPARARLPRFRLYGRRSVAVASVSQRTAATAGAVLIAVTALIINLTVGGSQAHDPASRLTSSRTHQSTPTRLAPNTNTTFLTPPALANRQQIAVRVFNNSAIADLAGRAAGDLRAVSWNVVDVGNYSQTTISTTTVYYRPATDEEAAAHELARQFSMHVEKRFSDIENLPQGLIVILTPDFRFA